jgi:hypothetical protein
VGYESLCVQTYVFVEDKTHAIAFVVGLAAHCCVCSQIGAIDIGGLSRVLRYTFFALKLVFRPVVTQSQFLEFVQKVRSVVQRLIIHDTASPTVTFRYNAASHPDCKRRIPMDSDLVLVTGASDYVAGYCILPLLTDGYKVRGKLRSRDPVKHPYQTSTTDDVALLRVRSQGS